MVDNTIVDLATYIITWAENADTTGEDKWLEMT
jgi:hypothetical protein